LEPFKCSAGGAIELRTEKRKAALQAGEGQAHGSRAEARAGAAYTNRTRAGTLLVTAGFHNEGLFTFISCPTLGVEPKFNE